MNFYYNYEPVVAFQPAWMVIFFLELCKDSKEKEKIVTHFLVICFVLSELNLKCHCKIEQNGQTSILDLLLSG